MKNLWKVIFIITLFLLNACQSYEIRKGDTGIELEETGKIDTEKKEQPIAQ